MVGKHCIAQSKEAVDAENNNKYFCIQESLPP
jgi:hypothetical protein